MDDSQDELLYMLAFSKFRLMKYDKANQLLTHLSHRTEMDPSILEAAMELKEELRKQGY